MRSAESAARSKVCKRRYQRTRFARWRAAGCCVDCGLPVTRFVRCLRCRVIRAAYDLARYHQRKVAA
jgi:hypothetical protein